MKKTIITFCLLFTFVALNAKKSTTEKEEKSNAESKSFSSSVMEYRKNYIYPEWGFFIDASPGLSFIQNNNLSPEIWTTKYDLGYAFNVGYFHSFSSSLKIKAGIGLSGYKNSLQGNGQAPPQQFKDIDNDNYTEYLTLTGVENNISPTFITVPALIEYGSTNITKIGFYVNLGMMYSFMVSDIYKPNGTYSTKGVYEQWGVTLEDIEELGFYSGKNLESNASFRKNNVSLLGGVGITIPMSSAVIFKAGFVGNYGLADLGNNQANVPDLNSLSGDTYSYRTQYIDNSLAVTKGTKTRQIGFEIGLFINKQLK